MTQINILDVSEFEALPEGGNEPIHLESVDNRRFVAALLGVWALLMQTFIPVVGANASEWFENGDLIWASICTSTPIFSDDENGAILAKGGFCVMATPCCSNAGSSNRRKTA
ncbi:MAG: hypothetical protein KUG61_05850 [Parvibaculaceae bacterium]|nr:hypothetical protein [Parvibaculaceae bacterium]